MIPYLEIEAESIEQGVSPQTIEKDYHLDWYLAALGPSKLFPRFSFYGGTAIKKLYIPNHRFSEDIDLISNGRLNPELIGQVLEQAHQFLEKEANLFYVYHPHEIQAAGTQTRFVIHYRGFSEISGIKRFLLDFAQGIEELPPSVPKRLLTRYTDLKDKKIKIRALPLEVICAEKLALIVDRRRKEPRDIYDLWSVLTQVRKFDASSFVARYEKSLSYKSDFSTIRSSLRDFDFKNAWAIRLKYQVPNLPAFEEVVSQLIEKLKALWKRDGRDYD